MNDAQKTSAMDVVILCGGMGTRLRRISGDLPKALVPFLGRPFLDFLIESLLPFGFRRFVLCVGHLQEKVRAHFRGRDYQVVFSAEAEPLGTGGALKNAAPMIAGTSFLVMNGDSICTVDFPKFHAFHVQKGGVLSLALAKPQSGQEYGVIEVDDDQRVVCFKEKNECRETMFINGGIYIMQRDIFDHMPAGNRFSLEYDLFPALLPWGCYGFQTDTEVIDIGTPERYVEALKKLSPSN